MRLWHKDLIDVLPRQQLTAQWRELCYIVKRVKMYGTPNHILVNPVIEFPLSHLYFYAELVRDEMHRRDYKCDFSKVSDWISEDTSKVTRHNLFAGWHNDRYLTQCVYNLQEKYDRGGIPYSEWMYVEHRFYGFATA